MRMRRKAEELRTVYNPHTVPLSEWPTEARLWCLKAGLSPDEAVSTYGFKWADKYNRLLLPILKYGEDTGEFVARDVNGHAPKYIASANARGLLWIGGTGTTTVVVEDILSAIKVSKAGYTAVAGMGTAFGHALRKDLPAQEVVGWLDNDKGGRLGWISLRKALALTDLPLRRVQSDRDPKLHSAQQIRNIIQRTPDD